MTTTRNGSAKERLLEIASRIHCPDSEGGKFAAQIKEEIEHVANTLGESRYGVTIEAAQFAQRVEPKFGTILYRLGDIWVEQMPKAKDQVGVYVGNFLVAIDDNAKT